MATFFTILLATNSLICKSSVASNKAGVFATRDGGKSLINITPKDRVIAAAAQLPGFHHSNQPENAKRDDPLAQATSVTGREPESTEIIRRQVALAVQK